MLALGYGVPITSLAVIQFRKYSPLVYYDDWEEQNDLEGPRISKLCLFTFCLFVCIVCKNDSFCTRGKRIVYFHCMFISYTRYVLKPDAYPYYCKYYLDFIL